MEIFELGKMQLWKLSSLERLKIGNVNGPSWPPYTLQLFGLFHLSRWQQSAGGQGVQIIEVALPD